MFLASEWIFLEAVVQTVHEDDEEDRSERVPLSNTSFEREWTAETVERTDAGRETRQAVFDQCRESWREVQAMKRACKDIRLDAIVRLFDVVEQGVHFLLLFATPAPRIQQFVDAFAGRAARNEASLGGVENWELNKDAAKAHSQHLAEEFSEAVLKTDRAHIRHRSFFRCVLDERQDDAAFPRGGECRRADTRGEESGHRFFYVVILESEFPHTC